MASSERLRLGLGSLLVVGGMLGSCGYPPSGFTPQPLTADAVGAAIARSPGVTADTLEDGRLEYIEHCNDCHEHPAILAFSEYQWRRIVPRMTVRAGLSHEDGRNVLEFVVAWRAAKSAEQSRLP